MTTSNLSNEFKAAQARLSTLQKDPGNDAKLKLYGLFKQTTVGDCNAPKPSAVDFVGKAKWNAWNDLKGTSKKNAEKKYIEYVNQLTGGRSNQEALSGSTHLVPGSSKFNDILVSIEFGNVYKITLNRPTKYNAITGRMYQEITLALKEADTNPNVMICAITGSGTYYSSGNDLTNYMKIESDSPEEEIERGSKVVEEFVSTFVQFKKPLIALVNGPSIGIMFTTLALFDLVIASDKATFAAPFTELALSPEGCSSYTFPLLMGRIKASEILLFNRRLNAQEAYERHLVNEIVAEKDFQKVCQQKLEAFSQIPQMSLIESRNFVRDMHRAELERVNKQEMQLLRSRIKSGEFMEAVLKFMNKKSKL